MPSAIDSFIKVSVDGVEDFKDMPDNVRPVMLASQECYDSIKELISVGRVDEVNLIFVEDYFWWFVNGLILQRLSNIFHDRVTSLPEIEVMDE